MENTASDIAQRLSREAESVCRHYLSNGRRQGNYWIVGDVENTAGRSLYVRLSGPASGKGAAGKWTDAATGKHGDLLDLIKANLRLGGVGEALDEARLFLSMPKAESPKKVPLTKVRTRSPEAARRLWAMAESIRGTLAERYLASRRIRDLGGLASLRFHPSCYYWREDHPPDSPPETWPAMLAKVTDNQGVLTGVHRTWLDPTSCGKAPLDPNRKAMGNLLGHAVRFGKPSNVMAIGEGLETMLSLKMTLPELPLAAALSGNHLAAFDPPDELHRLYVAIDDDDAGREAAMTLEDRAQSIGIETIPLHPTGGDFNDDLRYHGVEELRASLHPQLAPIDVQDLLRSGEG